MVKKYCLILFLLFYVPPVFAETDIIPRPEYPRQQFERNEVINLNGKWTFAETGLPTREQPDKDTDYEGRPCFVDEHGDIKWATRTKADSDLPSWGYGDNPKTLKEFCQMVKKR